MPPKSPAFYLSLLRSLRVDRSHGAPAPHKPILLLGILQAVKSGLITSGRIYVTPGLIALFRSNWSSLVTTDHLCKLALPFFYLRSEKFWRLVPRPESVQALKLVKSLSTINQLDSLVEYAEMDEELLGMMQDGKQNELLKRLLLEVYFPETKERYTESLKQVYTIFEEVEDKILREPDPETHQHACGTKAFRPAAYCSLPAALLVLRNPPFFTGLPS